MEQALQHVLKRSKFQTTVISSTCCPQIRTVRWSMLNLPIIVIWPSLLRIVNCEKYHNVQVKYENLTKENTNHYGRINSFSPLFFIFLLWINKHRSVILAINKYGFSSCCWIKLVFHTVQGNQSKASKPTEYLWI